MGKVSSSHRQRQERRVSLFQPVSDPDPLTVPPGHSDAIDELNLQRYCCRRMILTHVDLIEKLLKYVPSAECSEAYTWTEEREQAQNERTAGATRDRISLGRR